MTKRRWDDAVVGLTLLLGVVIIVAATLWARQADIGKKRPTVTARFREVGNARVGTPVVIRGVRAGRIELLEIDDDGWVTARIGLEKDTHVPESPAVVLGASSLFGEWQATITSRADLPDNPEVRRQINEASGDPGKLPGAILPDIAEVTATAGRIAGDVAMVAQRLEASFTDSASRELRASIRHIASLSASLDAAVRRQSREVDALSADLRTGAGEFAAATRAVHATLARADSATSRGEIARIVADAELAARALRATADDLRATTQRLARTQDALERAVARADSITWKVNNGRGTIGRMVNDSSVYVEADSLVRELRGLVADVKKNPKKYISLEIF
jgi:phospholipid/cholesterol/gamma-HCH transport system substrate-binding protein